MKKFYTLVFICFFFPLYVVSGETFLSLKKDREANLLNSTSGRMLDIIIRGNATTEEYERYNSLYGKLTSELEDDDKEFLTEMKEKYYTEEIKVFTTRPETIFGASFIALSVEHPLSSKFKTNLDFVEFRNECLKQQQQREPPDRAG